jgi:hypothetical protein
MDMPACPLGSLPAEINIREVMEDDKLIFIATVRLVSVRTRIQRSR